MIIGIDLTNNFLMFFAGAGVGFVGGAAQFKEKLTKNVHIIAAYASVIFSQLSIAFDFHTYYINIIFFSIAIILERLGRFRLIKNKIWWQEILAFLSIVYIFVIRLYYV